MYFCLKVSCLLLAAAVYGWAAGDLRIVLVAGAPSHYIGAHEHNAGMLLIAKCLKQNRGVDAIVVRNGWPEDETVFENARAIVFFADGGARHPLLPAGRLEAIGGLMKGKAGLGMVHYSLEVPKERGGPEFLDWIGGFYERPYSQNPLSELEAIQASSNHPASRGWKSFRARDEWYYRIRFAPDGGRVVPLLQAMLPKDNPQRETIAWAFEREGGGRGFGFTGGHDHANWGIPEYRQVVVNAILWLAGVDVPENGARCEVTPADLEANLDPGKQTREEVLRRIRKSQ